MKKNTSFGSRGQTMIEYGLIIALIISGIILGGPMIMNAINAHFKLLDSATQDSLTENIKRGAIKRTDCEWDKEWQSTGECGLSAGCQALDRLEKKDCILDGEVIETETQCVTSTGCCSQPVTVACGALLASNCSSRSSLNNKFSTDGEYQGTCVSNNRNLQDCRIGEKLASITCGKITQDFSYIDVSDDEDEQDPIDIVSSETFLACTTATFDECLPKCSPDLGDDDNPLFSKCYDHSDDRDLLEYEIENRQTTASQQKPYRNITRFTPQEARQDSSIMNGTVKIPYAFLTSEDECDSHRYCEAYCEQIEGAVYLPTSDGTSCAKAVCEKTRYASLDLPEHHFNAGPLPYTTQFTVDLLPYQNAVITYFDKNENVLTLTPDLSLYPEQVSVVSNYFSIKITPAFNEETGTYPNTAPGFSNLIFDKECFAYRPSHLITLDTPLLYACENNRKVITDARAYQRYCSAFDQEPYQNAIPYETDTHTIGCLTNDPSAKLNYFVFCE